jgi:mono/diheme cytochrome c family protein
MSGRVPFTVSSGFTGIPGQYRIAYCRITNGMEAGPMKLSLLITSILVALLLIPAGITWAQIDYNDRIQPIFNANCTTCHGGTSGVTLSSYAAVISSFGHQYGRYIIDPGDPDDSPLYDKISSDAPEYGSRMPEGGPPLSDEDIAAIRQWIEEGALEEVPTDADPEPIAYEFKLTGNYPNPFNPSTTITFTVPRQTDYTVRITNVLGKQLQVYQGASPAGEISVTVDLRSHSSGVYLYEVIADDGSGSQQRLTGSMALMK